IEEDAQPGDVSLLLIQRKLNRVLPPAAVDDHRHATAILAAEIGLKLPLASKRLPIDRDDAVSLLEAGLGGGAVLLHVGNREAVLRLLVELDSQSLPLTGSIRLLTSAVGCRARIAARLAGLCRRVWLL